VYVFFEPRVAPVAIVFEPNVTPVVAGNVASGLAFN